jgi:hypothetical protein
MTDIDLTDVRKENSCLLTLHTGPLKATYDGGKPFEDRWYEPKRKYVFLCSHFHHKKMDGWARQPMELGAVHCLARVNRVTNDPPDSNYRRRWHLTVVPLDSPFMLSDTVGRMPKPAEKMGPEFDRLMEHIRYTQTHTQSHMTT